MINTILNSSWNLNIHVENDKYKDFPLVEIGQKIVNAFCAYLKLKNNYQINLIVISIDEMKKINRLTYPFKKVSDVLSFPLEKYQTEHENNDVLGEIYFCYDIVKNQAEKKSISFTKEAKLLLIHSLLHFCGYFHDNEVRDELMKKIINNISKLVKI